MYSLKDSNFEIYKIFSEAFFENIFWNSVIRPRMIENGQDWRPIHLVIKKVVLRSPKSNGVQKQVAGFKDAQRAI